ncbi:MAG: SUMF1/EgtB/PvdO family nonheme iron enzyme [bacterium]
MSGIALLALLVFAAARGVGPPPKAVIGKDGAPMVLVPAGWFIMGSDDGDENEKPRRRVYLDAFYIDKRPVTNARFHAAGVSPHQDYGEKFHGPQQPVVCVAWLQAKENCQKAGKRLPTEAEWEKAARGTDGRKHPWGNSWAPDKLIWRKNSGDKTHPVDRAVLTHESPYGAADMAGNVWEWVSDWYDKDYYRNAPDRNPQGPGSGRMRVLRGGSWNFDNAGDFRAAARVRNDPGYTDDDMGFRCAQDLK